MSTLAQALTRKAWSAIGGNQDAVDSVSFTGEGSLPSIYPVTDFASAAIATAALAILELLKTHNGGAQTAAVDRRLSSFWFLMSIRPDGWKLPPPWDPIAGDYRARNGWIRLHTNAPHHRAAATKVLGPHDNRDAMAKAVAGWGKGELEEAIIEAGGCAAEMRTATEWDAHPQGAALAVEPLAHIAANNATAPADWPVSASRPLAGLRVLDLTRVLAGPVASRFLAAFGAEVLRIDPPDWDEPAVVPEVTLGKRCARLDLHRAEDRNIFQGLLSGADVFLHGYRPGALERLGVGPSARRSVSPGLIDVCLDAYGWSGPWASRRGFDSLVQMSSGIADAGMKWRAAEKPVPLPVQALDHATGYLMAAVAIRGITQRLTQRHGAEARLSLARTGKLLLDADGGVGEPLAPESSADLAPKIESTEWGEARRLKPPIYIAGTPMEWEHPASSLGSAQPSWQLRR